MTTAEIAAQYGVPLPETCKELNWQKETLFWWVHEQKEDIFKVVTSSFKKSFENLKMQSETNVFIAPAPQMHEIAKLLPERIQKSTLYYIATLNSIAYLRSPILGDIVELESKVKNQNYAQAYAELYLQLKSKNLL